jgi:hypothetical protein
MLTMIFVGRAERGILLGLGSKIVSHKENDASQIDKSKVVLKKTIVRTRMQ